MTAADYCAQAGELQRERRFDAAARTYEQALELPLERLDRARVLARLSLLRLELEGRAGRGAETAHQAVALLASGPEEPAVWAVRGVAWAVVALNLSFYRDALGVDLGQKALTDLERAAGPASGPEALEMAARMCLLLDRPQDAIAWGERYLTLETDPGAQAVFAAAMARALRLAGRLAEAERVLAAGLADRDLAKHAAAALYHEQGLLDRALGREREAGVAWERALGVAATYQDRALLVEAGVCLGDWCYAAGSFAEAAGHVERVLALLPEDTHWRRRALVWLGRCRTELGACGQARECFAEVLASAEASDAEQNDAHRGALCAVARSSSHSGDYRAAAKTYRRILEENPGDDEFRRAMLLWLADCCSRTGEPASARACYVEILSSPRASEAERERARGGLAALPWEPAGAAARRSA